MSDTALLSESADTGVEVPEVADEATTLDQPEVSVDGEATAPAEGRYRIKVQGEEREVALDELLELAQKGDDYTRKTQELSTERQRLTQAAALLDALDADPRSTIAALTDAFGVLPPYDDLDPEERRLREVERFMAEQRRRDQQAAIDREMDGLRAKYGDIDEATLVQHAVRHGIPTLEAAYAHMTYDDLRRKAEAHLQAQREAQEAQVIDAKRQAAVVEGGASIASGAVTPGTGDVRTFADAWALAKAELSH